MMLIIYKRKQNYDFIRNKKELKNYVISPYNIEEIIIGITIIGTRLKI